MEITGCFQLFSVIFLSHIVLGYSIIDGEKSEMKWRNDTKQTTTKIMRAKEKRKIEEDKKRARIRHIIVVDCQHTAVST